ncbi:COQ9 family protein [Poseidonocella sp. HB161398]|uniref:COQ9 family protein n=1 Tax=Poseidonocella sp. HB161398 TaxID=2320855 RepID=UPI001107AC05|nr:COQ9 family protein [Poseidonocella sp. HB161398]
MEVSENSHADVKDRLLEAILPHVVFDGWSEASFAAAIADSETAPALARAVCPRGAVDLALAFHDAGDREMLRRLAGEDLEGMRFRDRIARAVRIRLELVEDKEAVRRGATLFALPPYAPDGAKALWSTVDHIWTALGDSSDDVNWYTKRATLAGVYSATLLYWLGDDSPEHQRTWRFLDRRIDEVMQIEAVKKKVNDNALLRPLLAGPKWALSLVKAPGRKPGAAMPGSLKTPR